MGTTKGPELFLILIAAPDDPPIPSAGYQGELKTFMQSLSAHGIEFRARVSLMESASGGGFNLGEFFIALKTVGPPLAVAIGVWLRTKYGRKVKLKSKDVAVEASSVEEVEKLLKLAEKHHKKIDHK
jgi:hypothetical protein